MAKYADLIERIKFLERVLYFKEKEIQDANEMCDKLNVPNSKSGAYIGHRLFWYLEGKRQSNKTNENTEGYSQEEWEKRKQKLENMINNIKISNQFSKLPIVS